MNGDLRLYQLLDELGIPFEYHEHPPIPTIRDAMLYWKDIDSTHCKNLFFRNHKGNQHYLVILEYSRPLDIHDLEQRLKQGKLSLSSPERLKKYLGLEGGSVSPFGLINDSTHHVHLFIDENLKKASRLSFHPNINTATMVIPFEGFEKFLKWTGNAYEFLCLYDTI